MMTIVLLGLALRLFGECCSIALVALNVKHNITRIYLVHSSQHDIRNFMKKDRNTALHEPALPDALPEMTAVPLGTLGIERGFYNTMTWSKVH